MNPRDLILLSPYRLPAQNSLMLGNEDVACLLNGLAALWHPAALDGASGPPKIGSPYDYEQPGAGHVYAVPENPPLLLPDDWEQRVRDAGAVAFRCTPDRDATFANLREALAGQADRPATADALLALGPDKVGPFLGIGFGHATVDALFEAMEHENFLASGDFWQEVRDAVAALHDPEPDAWRRKLQSAADKLLAAREVLYPVTVHLIDLVACDRKSLAEPWPATFDRGFAVNVVASGAVLEHLNAHDPDRMAALREKVQADLVEVCGGPYLEREDSLLPLESQIWNILEGQRTYQRLLNREVTVYARKRFAATPQLPTLLNHCGLRRAVLLAFDDAVAPTYRVAVVNWSSPDGKQIEAFTRTPYHADNPQTYFHFAHYLHKTIMQDQAASLALLHAGNPAAPWYHDLLELCRFGPVLGQWTTLSRYLNEVLAGEYVSTVSVDDFHADYLSERTQSPSGDTVSWFAAQVRNRRRLDTAWALAALKRGIEGTGAAPQPDDRYAEVEKKLETNAPDRGESLERVEADAARGLADRLQSRAAENTPGYLVLNPCGFTRRVALELSGYSAPLPVSGPVKAFQLDGDKARLVVEVPPLGFAWFPQNGAPGTPAPASRMKLADARSIRNEFFEAEIDPATGGLRALRDHKTRVSRLGQQLVYNPGSVLRGQDLQITSTGPALGEIQTRGELLDEQGKVLAHFRQRFRAWLGRPLLEMRIELERDHAPLGYPWHGYYGARFAWRDERSTLLRGLGGVGHVSSHTRPETAEYLEIRLGRESTTIFPGGLPFHQRHGPRMVDVILAPEGEAATVFDLGIGLDREHPSQTALGLVTPVTVVPTTKGPPHVGATGWLYHLDAPNLLLTSLRPAADGTDALVLRLAECSNHNFHAELRCVRDPRRGALVDATGALQMECSVSGDAVLFEVNPCDITQLRAEFA